MSVWLVRAGKHGEQEEAAIRYGLVTIGWNRLPDLTSIRTREGLIDLYMHSQGGSARQVAVGAGQVWTFRSRIKVGDVVILPRKHKGTLAVGTVTGEYCYRRDLHEQGILHARPVEWLYTDLCREVFDEDILHSIGAFMTVCQIKRNDSEARIRKVIADLQS